MSDKIVTGDALNEILQSVKEYVDINDLTFEEAELDVDISEDSPQLTLTSYNIMDEDVDNIINKHFIIKDEQYKIKG